MDTIAGTGLQCVRLAWHDMLWCVRHAKMGQKPCNNMIILQFYAHTSSNSARAPQQVGVTGMPFATILDKH